MVPLPKKAHYLKTTQKSKMPGKTYQQNATGKDAMLG